MLGEHGAAEGIDLDLPRDRPEAGALKAALEAADAGEERTDHALLLVFRNGHRAGVTPASSASV